LWHYIAYCGKKVKVRGGNLIKIRQRRDKTMGKEAQTKIEVFKIEKPE